MPMRHLSSLVTIIIIDYKQFDRRYLIPFSVSEIENLFLDIR